MEFRFPLSEFFSVYEITPLGIEFGPSFNKKNKMWVNFGRGEYNIQSLGIG